tara:strand:- start:2412 stop:2948 length:537 start_codon:yes stop_codon:yes gene_type:complete
VFIGLIEMLSNDKVLLLNSSYEPINIIYVKKAIVMYFLDKVEVVSQTNNYIRSVNIKFPIPDIIKLKKYIYIKYDSIPLTRRNIIKRDHCTCQYCGKKYNDITIDHILPKDKGGKDIWTNLVAACKKCNLIKGNKLLKDTNMNLIKRPTKPSNLFYLQNSGKENKSWHPYLYLGKKEI